jgi:hypothetical protein
VLSEVLKKSADDGDLLHLAPVGAFGLATVRDNHRDGKRQRVERCAVHENSRPR